MKITQQKLFDSATLEPKTKENLGGFITFVNAAVDMFTRTLSKQTTLQDNIKCLVKTVALKHDTAVAVSIGEGTIEGVFLLQADEMITGFKWAYSSTAGQVSITVKTDSSEDTDAKICVLFQ
jgi:hypothetical protein